MRRRNPYLKVRETSLAEGDRREEKKEGKKERNTERRSRKKGIWGRGALSLSLSLSLSATHSIHVFLSF